MERHDGAPPVGPFRRCINARPGAGSSPAEGGEDGGDSRFKFPLFLPSDILSGRSVRGGVGRGGGVTTDRQCERPLCCGGGQGAGFWPQSLREAALKIQEMGAGAGEGGAGPSITWMLSRGGLGGSSQQIIKLSLIVAESEGWRGVSHKGRGGPRGA